MASPNKQLAKPGGARPQQLTAPGVNAEEADLIAALEGMNPGNAAVPAQDDMSELISALNQRGRPQMQMPTATEVSTDALRTAGKIADYGGGLIRTAGAAGAGAVAGALGAPPAQPIGTVEDFQQALIGEAPTSAQYMERAGVEEGISINLPKLGRVSQRDVSGFAADLATDPFTALAKLTKTTPIMTKFLRKPSPILDRITAVLANPGGTVANTLGEEAYKRSFSKLGEKIGQERARGVAKQLIKEGAPVGAKAVQEAAERLSVDMGNIRQGFYDYADQLGVTIDLKKSGTFGRSEALLNKWMTQADPATAPLVGDLYDLLNSYKDRGVAKLSDVSAFKTQLYHGLPKSAFQNNRVVGIADQFKNALADDMRRSIVRAGEVGERGLGKSIDKLNEVWGPIIEAQGPLAKQALIEGRSSALGAQIDAIAVASGNVAPAIARKAMEFAQTPYAKRAVGKALMRAGESGFVDALTRRALARQAAPPPTPLLIEEEAE